MSDVETELRELLEIAHDAMMPFAYAAARGANVYIGVQQAMKDNPHLFSYSSAYIDAGRAAAHSHLSWADYRDMKDAFARIDAALKGNQ